MSLETDAPLGPDEERPVRRRSVDYTDARARAAVAQTLERFGEWRRHIAVLEAAVERDCSRDKRASILAYCNQIECELREARTELLLDLAEAPPRVAGHSRVVDVEKALDNAQTALAVVRLKLVDSAPKVG